jgi:hypothetical protein
MAMTLNAGPVNLLESTNAPPFVLGGLVNLVLDGPAIR